MSKQMTKTLSWIFYSVSSLKQQSSPLGHIILILNHPVCALSP
jgi:hypothetical protein